MRIPVASALSALALALLALFAVRASAEAATPTGLDVSWPQCGKQLPRTPLAFAVVGVDNGRAFTSNPCLAEQYRWAGSTGTLPALYFTLRSPQGLTAGRGLQGPAGTCAASDSRCVAHNYGYHAAREARAYAMQQAAPPPSTMWWLDIETMSYWSTDQVANAQVVQGAIEYLTEQGLLFGVYSTRAQWNQITGGLALPTGLPLWIAGARDGADAPTMCTPRYTFGGGQLWLVQYIANDLDHNHVCGDPLSITILTRSISSAMATATAAVQAAAPEPPPAMPAALVAQEPLPSPIPLELAHLGGAGLPRLPRTEEVAPRGDDCSDDLWPASMRGHAASAAQAEADRPRHRSASRGRREA